MDAPLLIRIFDAVIRANQALTAMALTPEGQDIIRDKPVLHREREWLHGDQGMGQNCPNAQKPIHTPPQQGPGECEHYKCDNREWHSNGHVVKDQNGNVVRREPPAWPSTTR